MSSADDVMAIHRICALYSHVMDERDWAHLTDVYAPDGVLDLSPIGLGEIAGVQAIAAFLGNDKPLSISSTNFVTDLEPGGDRATGRCKWTSIRADGTIAAGCYRDEYVRTQAGWRIARRAPVRLAQVTAEPVEPGSQ